jgi:hypothetical protein
MRRSCPRISLRPTYLLRVIISSISIGIYLKT